MTTSVLVSFATRYGSTKVVAEVIADSLRECGLLVDVYLAREIKSISNYGAIILGAPLHMFHWHKDALRFLSRHQKALSSTPFAIFALGPVHVPHDDKEWTDSQNQLDKALADFPWLKPIAIEIFGGIYDPSKLGFPLKIFAGAEPASDALDKTAVIEWAANLAAKFESVLK